MLDELHVHNLALISDAVLEPARGLTALTGETGAGKSALLGAIKLLVGERSSADQVRDGSDSLTVEGRFIFADDDPELFADGHIAQRRVSAEGRSRCMLDGAMATVGQLASQVGASVDLCGQHDHQKLLSAANHRPLLDAWGGATIGPALSAYQAAFDAARQAQARLDEVRTARADDRGRLEAARFALARIDEVDPQAGEYEELQESLPRLEHAEALMQAARDAHEALSGDGGVLDGLASAASALREVGAFDARLDALAQTLEDAAYPLEDASRDLRRYRDDVEFDPQDLERIHERLARLAGLVRQFGPRMEDVLARREEARKLVALADDDGEVEREAQRALDAAESALAQAAGALTQARSACAPHFAAAVSAQMARLEMAGARLEVALTQLPRAQWGREGADAVEFLYCPGEGLSPRPFVRIASGGEVSRVMLSIKVALGAHDDVETLIFDEIDAGVGGSTARAIAEVLADLAQTHQVLVVTHLAQVAVRAQCHYVVEKGTSAADGRPETRLSQVSGEARVAEIARMLSGDEGASSLAHARALLDEAAAAQPQRTGAA